MARVLENAIDPEASVIVLALLWFWLVLLVDLQPVSENAQLPLPVGSVQAYKNII